MNIFVLYLVILKATITSFSGPSSLPILRDELVVRRHAITDHQLNAAVVAGRCAPGPMGIYVVSAGYFAAGIPGAIAGFLALITPSFLVVPVLRYLGNRANDARIRSTLGAVVIASAGLVLVSAEPLAKDAVTGLLPAAIAIASFVLLIATRIETVWLIFGSAMAGLLVRAVS
jgi:chromate transporter